ncbi:hypothetical protein WUBG_17837, partial [Wuchereria bancrofti]
WEIFSEQRTAPNYGTSLQFDLANIPIGGQLVHAELRIFFNGSIKPRRVFATIPYSRDLSYTTTIESRISGSGHFVINITETLLRWIHNRSILNIVTLYAISAHEQRTAPNYGTSLQFDLANIPIGGQLVHAELRIFFNGFD